MFSKFCSTLWGLVCPWPAWQVDPLEQYKQDLAPRGMTVSVMGPYLLADSDLNLVPEGSLPAG